jgi:hypothetical protein
MSIPHHVHLQVLGVFAYFEHAWGRMGKIYNTAGRRNPLHDIYCNSGTMMEIFDNAIITVGL